MKHAEPLRKWPSVNRITHSVDSVAWRRGLSLGLEILNPLDAPEASENLILMILLALAVQISLFLAVILTKYSSDTFGSRSKTATTMMLVDTPDTPTFFLPHHVTQRIISKSVQTEGVQRHLQ